MVNNMLICIEIGLPLICCIDFIGSKFSVSNHVMDEKPKPTLNSFSKRP